MGSGPTTLDYARRHFPAALAARFHLTGARDLGAIKHLLSAVERETDVRVSIAWVPDAALAVFRDEAAVTQRVTSPNVPRISELHVSVPVEASDRTVGDGYVVMERCEGPTLAQLIEGGPLVPEDAAPILLGYARGCRAICAIDRQHRDIMLETALWCASPSGATLKLLDLGTSAQSWVVSKRNRRYLEYALPYMSRDQIRGMHDETHAAYALAACCFRLVVGEPPIVREPGDSQFDYLRKITEQPADVARLPATLPAAVRDVLARALDVAPDRRPEVSEIAAVLEHAFSAR